MEAWIAELRSETALNNSKLKVVPPTYCAVHHIVMAIKWKSGANVTWHWRPELQDWSARLDNGTPEDHLLWRALTKFISKYPGATDNELLGIRFLVEQMLWDMQASFLLETAKDRFPGMIFRTCPELQKPI